MVAVIIAACVALLAVIAVVFCTAPGRMPPEAKRISETFKGLNCAHRGLYGEDQQPPENSIPAFEAARAAGYGAELDVQLSSDGQVVVFHDDGLDRACGVAKPVNSLSREELSALPLFGTSERMPLLTEALGALGDAPVIVELKPAGASNALLCEKTLAIMREHGRTWCVESFDPRIVGWFLRNAPDVLRGQLGDLPRNYENQPRATAFLLGNLLTNFISRPHFVAYGAGRRPLTARLCMAMGAFKIVWTLRPEHDTAEFERANDAFIFEHYSPAPRR